MFKRKGGSAFKPSIPAPRPNPSRAQPAAAARNVQSQPSIDSSTAQSSSTAVERPKTPQNAPISDAPQKSPARPPLTRSSPRLPPRPSPKLTSQKPAPIAEQTDEGASSRGQQDASAAKNALPTINESDNGAAVQTEGSVPLATPSASTAVQPSTQASSAQSGWSYLNDTPRITSSAAPDIGGQNSSTISPPEQPPTTSSAPEPTAKAVTRSAKRAAASTESNDANTTSRPPAKRRRTQKPRAEGEAAPRPRSRKRKGTSDNNNNTQERPEAARKRRRARSPTPEDAENQTVDLQQLRMADLTKDLRIGKKFSRHDELRERERKARSARSNPTGDASTADNEPINPASPAVPNSPDSSAANGPGHGMTTAATTAPLLATGPQFRIVDGQIVLDQSSLFMDRHARAAAAQAAMNMETVEENDFTRLITSSSFTTSTTKLKGPNIWTEDETELFYRGLSMFGTEFEMISKMFPGKQRRHVKLKFNREERHNPARIDAALVGEKTTKLDIDEYRAFTGADFEPVEVIEAEQRQIEEAYELERRRVADEQAEIMRKKREALFADDDGGTGGGENNKDKDGGDQTSGAGMAGGKKKGGRRRGGKQQAVSYGLNGEPIPQNA